MTDLQRPPSILENRTLNRLVTPLSKMGNFLLCSNPPVPAHVSKQPGYIGEFSVEEPSNQFSKEGWLEKLNRRGRWQRRYFNLRGGLLNYRKSPDTVLVAGSIDLSQISDVNVVEARHPTEMQYDMQPADDRTMYITFLDGAMYHLRAADIITRSEWVQALRQRLVVAAPPPQPLLASDWSTRIMDDTIHMDAAGGIVADVSPDAPISWSIDTDTEGEEVVHAIRDSDEDEPGLHRAASQTPRWMRKYTKYAQAKDRQGTWALLTLTWLDKIFAKEPDHASNTLQWQLEWIDTKVQTCLEQLRVRVNDCKAAANANLLRHHIQIFDVKFLQEIAPITTGRFAESYAPSELTTLSRLLEQVVRFRGSALGPVRLTAQESRAGIVLRELRRDVIQGFARVMAPKVRGVTIKVLEDLKSKQVSLVSQRKGRKVGTSCPGDLFALLCEHLNFAHSAGTPSLEVKMISIIMSELMFYQTNVLMFMLDLQATAEGADIDFAVACVNDCHLLTCMVDELEAKLNVLGLVTEAEFTAQRARAGSALEAELQDFHAEEAAILQEELASIQTDVPRTKSELRNIAQQLTGLLVDVIVGDFNQYSSAFVTSAWEADGFRGEWSRALAQHFHDIRIILEDEYFPKFALWTLSSVVARYVVKLVNPSQLPAFGEKAAPVVKLDAAKLVAVATDEICMRTCVNEYLPRADISLVLQTLQRAREFLTNAVEILLPTFEMSMLPNRGLHVLLMFERCLAMRGDVKGPQRKSLLHDAERILQNYMGNASSDDVTPIADERRARMQTSTGWLMSQTPDVWRPEYVTSTILFLMFDENEVESRAAELHV